MTLDIPSSLCFSLPVSTLLFEYLYFVIFFPPCCIPVISSNKTVGDRLVSYFRRLFFFFFFSHSRAVLVVPWPKPPGFPPQDRTAGRATIRNCLDGDWMNLLSQPSTNQINSRRSRPPAEQEEQNQHFCVDFCAIFFIFCWTCWVKNLLQCPNEPRWQLTTTSSP